MSLEPGTSLDLTAFLRCSTAAPSNFSADGSKVLIQSTAPGTAQLFTVPTLGGDLRQITDKEDSVAGSYLPVGTDIVAVTAAGGNERSQLYLVSDDGTGWRPLVVDPDHLHEVGGVSRDATLLAYASDLRNGSDVDIYVLDLGTRQSRLVHGNAGWCQARGFSPDGRWLSVSVLTERSGDNRMLLVDLEHEKAIEVAPHDTAAYVGAPAWCAGGTAFYFATDIDRDLAGIARYDLGSRSWEYVLERPGDTACVMNWPGTHLLVQWAEDGATLAQLLDPASLDLQSEVPLPGRGVASFGFSRDGARLAYSFTSPVEPGDAWCFDIDTATTRRLTHSPRQVAADMLVTPSLDAVVSDDGERVPYFVYRPGHAAASPAPVVLWLHGGPESQYVPRFDPTIQYLVHHGYAVIAPNVRGSTGYGKRFEHLDDQRRRLDVLLDLAAIHRYVESDPLLDAARIALMGGSYGGYLVLAGLAFQPQLWAAGVDIVGISSLTSFLTNTASWRRRARELEYGFLHEDGDFLKEASPLTRAAEIRAPLFIVHGANDPRVPVAEAQQIHDEVTRHGLRCELLIYGDEGHGLTKLANRLDAYPRICAFLDDVLRTPGVT
ncbi:MAG: alpha/beta fold hydrolase [Acidimicrobiales bacterium]